MHFYVIIFYIYTKKLPFVGIPVVPVITGVVETVIIVIDGSGPPVTNFTHITKANIIYNYRLYTCILICLTVIQKLNTIC